MSFTSELELEEELEEEYPFSLHTSEGEFEATSNRCPDDPNVVTGFSRYSDSIKLLPETQSRKLQVLSRKIKDSLSGAPGTIAVTHVLVVGHADRDAVRERRQPGFLQFISERRALATCFHLSCALGDTLASRIGWIPAGLGARVLSIPNPRTEVERKCNRRVEIALRSGSDRPRLDQSQEVAWRSDAGTFTDYYRVALQGTSGQYEQPYVATAKAKEIAEKVTLRIKQHHDQSPNCQSSYVKAIGRFLNDALQGTASKFSDPDIVVSKAFEAAEQTAFMVIDRQSSKIAWDNATLPQPMTVDCYSQGPVPGGRAGHVLCGQHNHVLDMTEKKVIARDLDDYKKRFGRSGI